MQSITCPHCSRVGSLKTAVPVGTRVRCPGCQQKFEIQPDPEPDNWESGSELIDLDDEPEPPALQPTPSPPPANFAGIDDEFDPSKLAPSAATAHQSPKFAPSPVSPLNLSLNPPPSEPWFYRWVNVFARVLWYGALTGVAVTSFVIVGVVLIIFSRAGDVSPGTVVFVAYAFLMVVVGYLPAFLMSALLQLAVDVGRNIRAIRYR